MQNKTKEKFELEKNNEKFKLVLIIKGSKIGIKIEQENSIPNTVYYKDYSLEDLQKIAKYFKVFDSIDDFFEDFKEKFSKNNYELNIEDIEQKIVIKIITNI